MLLCNTHLKLFKYYPARKLVDSQNHLNSKFLKTLRPVSTMKQKIVMKVQFSSQKRRTDAFKIAAGTTGVSDVSIEADKDQVVVIGEGVDSVCLAQSLKRKLKYVEIVSVAEVKKPEEKKEEKKPVVESIPVQWASNYVYYPMNYDVVYHW